MESSSWCKAVHIGSAHTINTIIVLVTRPQSHQNYLIGRRGLLDSPNRVIPHTQPQELSRETLSTSANTAGVSLQSRRLTRNFLVVTQKHTVNLTLLLPEDT